MKYHAKSNIVYGDVILADFAAFAFYANYKDGAQRDVETITVPGKDGELLIDNGRYGNVAVEYRVQVTGVDNIRNLRAALLSQTGYNRLEDEYEPNAYRVAYISEPPEIVQEVADAAAISLKFSCKPQRYLKVGELGMEFTGNSTIYNPTSYTALPLVRVYGAGSVGIGANTIRIADPGEYTDIDCEIQDAFEGSTNRNSSIRLASGEFFKLRPGANGISLSAGITKVIVTPRWYSQ